MSMLDVYVHANVRVFVPVSMSTFSMDTDMQHGHIKQHGHRYAAWTCIIVMDMQHGPGHDAWTSSTMNMEMQQYEHGDAAV
jgi:hypothetical protein